MAHIKSDIYKIENNCAFHDFKIAYDLWELIRSIIEDDDEDEDKVRRIKNVMRTEVGIRADVNEYFNPGCVRNAEEIGLDKILKWAHE